MARENDEIKRIDKIIGYKVYSLRVIRGLSRWQLAEVIGVTPQQLQKYEKGSNRISAGRLVMIARVLGQRVSYFYEGLEDNDSEEEIIMNDQQLCIDVIRNFVKSSLKQQREYRRCKTN